MTLIFRLALLCLVGWTQNAAGREVPTTSTLAEKVARSEIIALVDTIEVHGGDGSIDGVHEYAEVRIVKLLKGQHPFGLSFVTQGFVAEGNPNCCSVGKRYLVFGMRGAPVFSVRDGTDSIVFRGQDKYLSGADWASSAYEVSRQQVLHWRGQDDAEGKQLCEVVKEIGDVIQQQSLSGKANEVNQGDGGSKPNPKTGGKVPFPTSTPG